MPRIWQVSWTAKTSTSTGTLGATAKRRVGTASKSPALVLQKKRSAIQTCAIAPAARRTTLGQLGAATENFRPGTAPGSSWASQMHMAGVSSSGTGPRRTTFCASTPGRGLHPQRRIGGEVCTITRMWAPPFCLISMIWESKAALTSTPRWTLCGWAASQSSSTTHPRASRRIAPRNTIQ